jgi:hypothetical protein
MLQTGDLIPHFTVTTFSGESFDYSDIWQRKNLVLVLLPHADWRPPPSSSTSSHPRCPS